MIQAFFEHIAIAVHVDDLHSWDRVLRADLGGEALLGGAVPKIGFQGGQVGYPDGGMLELLSWLPGSEGAMKRYVERQGGRAALHHLTFLVEDFDAALERSRALDCEPMLGRSQEHWKEFYVREPALRPEGFLIQVLFADKDEVAQGWGHEWEPFTVRHPEPHAAARIAGVQLGSVDLEASQRLFVELLGAKAEAGGERTRELSWPESSMRLSLVRDGESHIRVQPSPNDGIPLADRLAAPDRPPAAAALLPV